LTGNRRILPIVVSDINWNAYAEVDKTDLLIESFHLYKKYGTDAWQLTKDEIITLNDATQNNVQPAVEKELLFNYFEIPNDENANNAEWLTNSEIKNILESYTEQKINQNKLGAVLKSIGCKKVSRHERNNRGCYFLINKNKSSNYVQVVDNKRYPF
jgi:Glu-tRNA(Gln) amidotransferase subunit E-like FAD-binding protein